jgi:hypothetical protein
VRRFIVILDGNDAALAKKFISLKVPTDISDWDFFHQIIIL